MRRCPRCNFCMIQEWCDVSEGQGQIWRCLGCGREMLFDPIQQAEDERLLEQIRRHGPILRHHV